MSCASSVCPRVDVSHPPGPRGRRGPDGPVLCGNQIYGAFIEELAALDGAPDTVDFHTGDYIRRTARGAGTGGARAGRRIATRAIFLAMASPPRRRRRGNADGHALAGSVPSRPRCSRVPVLVTGGNHEVGSSEARLHYLERWPTPYRARA